MTQSPAVDNDHPDRQALRVIKGVFEQAVRDNKLDLLKPHLDPLFSVVSFTNREFTDFEAFKAQWQKTREAMLKGGSYTVELLPDPSLVFGDIALSHGDSKNVLKSGTGETFEFGSRWTVVCRKMGGAGGQWKIVRAHSSLSPFDNPMILAAVKKKVLQIAAIAWVVGLLIGGLAVWLMLSVMR